MRHLFVAGFVLAMLNAAAQPQLPTVGIYTDTAGTDSSLVVGGRGLLELYVIVDYPAGVWGVEFSAPKPDCFGATYLAQTSPFPAVIGDSQTGVRVGLSGCYGTPVHVLTLRYWVNSIPDCCEYPVLAHPDFGIIRVTDCSADRIPGNTIVNVFNPRGDCYPPSEPANPVPADGDTTVGVVTTLSWQSADPFGDPLTFDVYFGTAPDPPLAAADLATSEYTPDILAFDTDYYWKVAAEDPAGNLVFGPEWRFRTVASSPARLEVYGPANWCGPAANDTVTVDVQISDSDYPIASGGFDLVYDNERLTWLYLIPGDLTQGWQGLSGTDLSTAIRVTGSGSQPIPEGSSGTFAKLVFLSHCCGISSITISPLCPENTAADMRPLWPVCGQFRCDYYPADGDVDSSGAVTPGDALCALQAYLSFPDRPVDGCGTPGWDVRSDVDCGGTITPADALCIFHSWLDGSCLFCGAGAMASSAPDLPGVTVADVKSSDTEIRVTLAVSGVSELDAFGFDIHYPTAAVAGVTVNPAEVTTGFDALAIRERDGTNARVGAYAATPVAVTGGAHLVELRFTRKALPAAGTITIDEFVDDLAGAGPVSIGLTGYSDNETPTITQYALHQNHPNPFNPDTEIRYEIPDGVAPQRTTLSIYDVAGRRIRQLVDRIEGGGLCHARWNGCDDAGAVVSSGVYFYVLRTADQTITRKMVLLR